MKKKTTSDIVKTTLFAIALASSPITKAEPETAPANNSNQTEKTNSDKIIGTWKLVGVSMKMGENTNEIYPGVFSVPYLQYFNFKSGGDFLKEIRSSPKSEDKGKWVFKSDKVSVIYEDITVEYNFKINDETHMYLSYGSFKEYYEK